ncbi:MAG: aminotransferase class V-fold PLP-dependent enzyme [Paracoccaceae bacterium]|jgi:glutamate/tyrosine decarboxylase-like PLP-dependent enzyme
MAQKPPFPADEFALDSILRWTRERILKGPNPRNGAQSQAVLEVALGNAITPGGITGTRAFKLFTDSIIPSTRPFNHPTSLAFVAAAPTPASLAFDAALGAAEIFAGNWDGGSGAIHAENQALSWLASLAGWPSGAGGAFVSGGTLGNLSALHAARAAWTKDRPDRWRILCSREAHSSIAAVARVMDVELVMVDADDNGRMSGQAARGAMADGVFAIVGNAGATNCGAVDDLDGLAALAAEHKIWLHVDGAYGLAALADPETRKVFKGIDRADSFIVDPHKWLFAPYDSCALVYRDPIKGAQAHGQQGAYLDTLDHNAWNPSDYALQLTRRARGLPLWFSLVTYGTQAYELAIAKTIQIARDLAQEIDEAPNLELLLGPQLTVILFKAAKMRGPELAQWCEAQRRSGALLCLPTKWRGEEVLRLCIVNPETDKDHVMSVLRTLV